MKLIDKAFLRPCLSVQSNGDLRYMHDNGDHSYLGHLDWEGDVSIEDGIDLTEEEIKAAMLWQMNNWPETEWEPHNWPSEAITFVGVENLSKDFLENRKTGERT